MNLISMNPYTEQVIRKFVPLTPAETRIEVEKSRAAQRNWACRSMDARAAATARLAAVLRAEKRAYARLITLEMGKPIREAVSEIEKCAWLCEYYAQHAARFLEPEEILTENARSYVLFQPLGLVLAIMPWNFPFWQAFRFGVPAVCAGNAVLLKHASNVPMTALAIEDSFLLAGFPDHVFKTLLIDSRSALGLIEEDLVEAVSLTGSNAAGEQVASVAGRKIKKMVLELGGSDPFIVLEDADVPKAAAAAAGARMLNAGQSCIAAKRFVVAESVADEFLKLFIRRLEQLKMGDPMEETTDVGPLARRDILEELQAQLRDAEEQGAQIFRLERSFSKGFFFAPCVVTQVTDTMRVWREEVFGPIAAVRLVRNEQEAIQAANDTPYGLGASLWCGNRERAARLAERLEAGCIAVNDMVKSDPRLPFGGIKKSGVGRELSHYGLKEFVNIKTVVLKE